MLQQQILNKEKIQVNEETAVQRLTLLELGDPTKSKPVDTNNRGRQMMERMGWNGSTVVRLLAL
jgi:hypothetical protein